MNIRPDMSLNEWTSKMIEELLENDEGEQSYFDFKASLHADPRAIRSDHDHRIRKTMASFANTSGGFVIFGIKDKQDAASWKRLIGVSKSGDFGKELSDKLSAQHLVPHLVFEGPVFIPVIHDGKELMVAIVKVEKSDLRPHALIVDRGLLQFWVRGNSTAEAASYSYLTKLIEDSLEVRNWLAALYLDTEYIDGAVDEMVVTPDDRSVNIPIRRISSLVNSEQSSIVMTKIPTDVQLIYFVFQLRSSIDLINAYRDIMVARLTGTSAGQAAQNLANNNTIASNAPRIHEITAKIREHLVVKYAGIREWISVLQAEGPISV